MNTTFWGPSGWLFLHSIVQNYPWKPTLEQKNNYLIFLKQVGNVLPCRYCRESYQEFINEPNTLLDKKVMESRKTLVKWLFDIHNKVNKKLGVTNNPTLKEVWNKYESFRSKCTKSPEIVKKIKTGCLDPFRGYRKKCLIQVINVDKDGNSFGKKTIKKKSIIIKLISIKRSTKKGKKLMATFEIGGHKKKNNTLWTEICK